MKASEFKLITTQEYFNLENPVFHGQTGLDDNGMYYMFWECKGQFYKTHQHI
jgi:hypothetical protein